MKISEVLQYLGMGNAWCMDAVEMGVQLLVMAAVRMVTSMAFICPHTPFPCSLPRQDSRYSRPPWGLSCLW